MRQRGNESGQATVEAVLALFVLMILLVGAVSVALTAYSVVSINARIQKVSWNVDVAALSAASDKDAFMQTMLISGVSGLPADDLSVANASVRINTVDAKRNLGADDSRYGISEVTQAKQVAKVSFDVSFRVVTLFAGSPESLRQTRHVEHDIVLDQQSEVR